MLMSYLPWLSLLALSALVLPTLLSPSHWPTDAAPPLWDSLFAYLQPIHVALQSLVDTVARWARLFARLSLVAAALLMLVGPKVALAVQHNAEAGVPQEIYWRCGTSTVGFLCEVRECPSQALRDTLTFSTESALMAAREAAGVVASIAYQPLEPIAGDGLSRVSASKPHRDVVDQFSDIRHPSSSAPGLTEFSLVLAGLVLLMTATRKLSGWKGAGIALGSLLVSSMAMAQAVDAGAGSVVLFPTSPSPDDPILLAQQLLNILAGWKSAGLVGSLIAVVNVVVNLTKLPVFDALTTGRPWLKPVVALVSGSLLAGLGAAASGAALPGALLAGLVAGLGSAGLHELVTVLVNGPKVAARQAGDAIAAQVAKGDAAAKAQWEAQKAHVDAAFNIPDERARLEHLADLGNAQAKAGG